MSFLRISLKVPSYDKKTKEIKQRLLSVNVLDELSFENRNKSLLQKPLTTLFLFFGVGAFLKKENQTENQQHLESA